LRQSGRESYVQETDISGLGIRVAVDGNKAKLAFENLVQVRETRKAFYLFLSSTHAWILPKAQMEDPAAESAQLRELFNTVLERKKLRLKK
ncbi:MAG: YcxB family protein, partial [Oscillospiraceae bacterium]|nr:YcxB family protein [Oscillospiraceae bacterium]